MADTCPLHQTMVDSARDEKERNEKEHKEIKDDVEKKSANIEKSLGKIFDLIDKINGKMLAILLWAVGVLGAGLVGAIIFIATQLAKKGTP
jgi:hypothetical protein